MSAPVPLPRKKPRPSIIQVQPENIPEELRLRPNWVVAKNKRPLMPDGRPASCSDPKTWVDFDTALKAYQRGVGDALWFALDGVPREDGLVLAAIDLDSVESTQERLDAARRMLTSLNTYWEQSPSGKGLRAICWARPLPSGKNSDGIELYTSKRFVSITGAVVKGRRRITDCADKFERLVPSRPDEIAGTPLPCTNVDNSALMAGLDSFPPQSLEDIQRAALAIPAEKWRERNDWWRLISALAHEAVMRPADANGLKQIMHDASSRPGAFEAAFGDAYDSAANDAQWEQALRDTRKRLSNGERAITLATLLHEATSHGWAPERNAPAAPAIDVKQFVVTNPERWKIPPPRQWLVRPYLIRGNYTVISASGGQGKTTWSLALMLMASAGRAGMLPGELLGKPRCIYISAEDTADELRRRVHAGCLLHNIDAGHLGDRLAVIGADELSFTLNKTDRLGRPVVDEGGFRMLEDIVRQHQADVFCIDPLTLFMQATINDPSIAAATMRRIARVAQETSSAALVVHHVNKAAIRTGAEADQASAAGSMGIINHARAAYTLLRPSDDEALKLSVPLQDIPGLVSLANVKANLTPAAADREWFRLRGVTLPNADPVRGYIHGDQVQAIESYTPGSGGPLFPAPTLRTVAGVLAQGVNGEPYSPSSQPDRNYTGAVAAALRPLFGNAPDAHLATLARKAVAELVNQGAIRIDERVVSQNRNRRKAIIVDKASPLFDQPVNGPFAEAF